MAITGTVAFSAGTIVLNPAATLRFDLTSSISPFTGTANDPIGPDFLAGKLKPFPTAAVALAPAGASSALAGTATATLYGQHIALTPAAAPTPALLNFTTPHAS